MAYRHLCPNGCGKRTIAPLDRPCPTCAKQTCTACRRYTLNASKLCDGCTEKWNEMKNAQEAK